MITKYDGILYKAVEFANKLGLKCYMPNELNVGEREFLLYSVCSDDLVPIHARPAIWGKTYFPIKGTKKQLEDFAESEHKKGCHTYIIEVGATSDGYLNKKFKKNPYRLVQFSFHEGAHRAGLETGAIHEVAATLIEHEAALLFYKKFGTKDDVKKVKQQIEDYKETCSEHRKRLRKRMDDLANGELISQNHPYNNARIYVDHIYHTHYPLMREVYKKMSSLELFIKLSPRWSTDEREGVRDLKMMSGYYGNPL